MDNYDWWKCTDPADLPLTDRQLYLGAKDIHDKIERLIDRYMTLIQNNNNLGHIEDSLAEMWTMNDEIFDNFIEE